jgi:hypothetical protein
VSIEFDSDYVNELLKKKLSDGDDPWIDYRKILTQTPGRTLMVSTPRQSVKSIWALSTLRSGLGKSPMKLNKSQVWYEESSDIEAAMRYAYSKDFLKGAAVGPITGFVFDPTINPDYGTW